jgi:hypothetical protein
MQNEKKANVFEDLSSNLHFFIDNLETKESETLQKILEQIKKNIREITKIALIRNLQKTDDPKIIFSKGSNVKLETKNFYPNILELASELDPSKVEYAEKKITWYVTKGNVVKTIKELEKLLEKKTTEEWYRNDILQQKSYTEMLELLNLRCIKIQNQILNFENGSNVFESNRIGLLLYILGFNLNHKLKVYGNDTEAYIYDQTTNKTRICGNNKNYKTYMIADKKDFYDIGELSKTDLEKNSTIVDFESAQQRESRIKDIVGGNISIEKSCDTPISQTWKQDIWSTTPPETPINQPATTDQSKETFTPDIKEILLSEFTTYYKDWKFDYNNFVELIQKKYWITLPAKLSSLNSIFGRNPYISSKEYTLAILAWDKEKIKEIEIQMRDRWYKESKQQDTQKIRDEFGQYFALQTEEEKKEFKKTHPDLFKNLRHKAQKLWWLPIPKEEYLQALLEENRAKCFVVAEREYATKICEQFPYSKWVSDMIKNYKLQWGKREDLTKYIEYIAKGEIPQIIGGNIVINPDKNGQKSVLYTRKSNDTIDKQDIREIFENKETGEFEISTEKYEYFLRQNPENQKEFPKNIYDLIPYFKDEDPLAHKMIRSIKYLQALLEGDTSKAIQERKLYLQKKIKESRKPEIQTMLMLIWKYLEKYWDKSCSEWTLQAKSQEIDLMMTHNPGLKKRILNNGGSIVSYCIMNANIDLNCLDYSSLKSILSPKIKEIHAIAPHIYQQEFKI